VAADEAVAFARRSIDALAELTAVVCCPEADDRSELSELELRVRALESILVERG
jgi:hypothetical protein